MENMLFYLFEAGACAWGERTEGARSSKPYQSLCARRRRRVRIIARLTDADDVARNRMDFAAAVLSTRSFLRTAEVSVR